MSLIIDTIAVHLPPKRKATPSGWISFNAVCCHHNGDSADTRQRGGIMINEGVSYHCFNCGFKASWQPGRHVSGNFKKLMRWLHVSDDLINKCGLDALRLKEGVIIENKVNLIPKFIDKALPPDTVKISEANANEGMLLAIQYIAQRGFYLDDFDWFWSENYANRLIIPYYYHGRIVGFTARLTRDGKPKYISEQQPGYVFNLDRQQPNRRFVIVCEGPFDAISIDGVAVLGSEISEQQRNQINQLQREVIVLPDRDRAGSKLIDQAVEYGWSVSFPDWDHSVKDANDAMIKYGRLYTLWSILNSKESNNLKIQLIARKWINKEKE